MEAFRKSYWEPKAQYGASAFAVHGFASHIKHVEVARNEAARAASGCLKAAAIPKLQSLSGMRSLRDIGEMEATLVMDKALRLQPDTPVAREAQTSVLNSRRNAGSWRDSSANHLAEKGILALPRNEIHPPIQKDRSINRFLTFKTPISAKDDPEEKRTATEDFILERNASQPADIEIWTDGSVGKVPLEFVCDLHHGERVSMKWDEGWYTATLRKFNPTQYHDNEAAKKFEARHGRPPDVLLAYDDGDEHAYGTTPTDSKQRVIACDEDGDTLEMYRTIPFQVGGAGILILRDEEVVVEASLAAGAVGSSFDAEAFAAVQAFQAAADLHLSRGSTIRWFTDSRSCLDALNGQPRMFGDMVRNLWNIMDRLFSDEVRIECVWIPSHCGVAKNEVADDLARRGILESDLVLHQTIPLTLEAARSIIKPPCRSKLLTLPTLPKDLHISQRRAEAVLHQLMVNCCPIVACFHHGHIEDEPLLYDPVCKMCPHGVMETVEHLIIRCSGRAASRRQFIGRVRGKTVEDLCRERPVEILQYLNNENLL